jgi:ATP-binding cassette subfamily B protein
MVFVALSNYAGILIPQEIRKALNYVVDLLGDGDGDVSTLSDTLGKGLLLFAGTVLALSIGKGILMYFMRQTIIVNSRLIEYDMRKEVFDHLSRLDLAFYKRNKTGDIMSRVSEDVNKVRMYLGPALLYGINLTCLFAFTIFAMIQVSPKLTLYTLAPLPFLSLSIYYVSSRINLKSEEIQSQLSKLTSTAQEVYAGIRVVKSYTKEDQFVNYFDDQSDIYKSKSLELARIKAFFHPLMILMVSLSSLVVIYVGGIEVTKGTISYGNIAEFIIYVNMLTWPVTAIGWIASIIQEAEASQKRINYLLQTAPEITNPTSDVYNVEGKITFENVTYVYPDTGIKALDNVSFDLEAGQKLAIVGRTASGKSTVADLILRLYDVTSGRIMIDDVDVKAHNLDLLRRKIGYVPQDVFLFSEKVSTNIALGARESSEEDIKRYADFAAVRDDIETLPEQFDTKVGERGVTLSGGQKQRVSIARAFIKHPDIVLLDDALSAVDTKTEQQILEYLNGALADKTAIVITHRLNSLTDYDKIIVLEEGRIAEEGTHRQLVDRGGIYAEMLNQQQVVDLTD